jgi:ribosomal-protein-alanine N-acetyltransferase
MKLTLSETSLPASACGPDGHPSVLPGSCDQFLSRMPEPIETERLVLREIVDQDAEAMFVMDSDPIVHETLGNQPVTDITQVREAIANIRQQYNEFGTGRFAVVLKETNEFIGWCGVKWETHVYGDHLSPYFDLGYRYLRKHWGHGYATEAATAALRFAFSELKVDKVAAIAFVYATGSCRVLQKLGFNIVGDKFLDDGDDNYWFEMGREEYWAMNAQD